MTEKKALGAQELVEAARKFRSAHLTAFWDEEKVIQCMAEFAASLADSPSPTAPITSISALATNFLLRKEGIWRDDVMIFSGTESYTTKKVLSYLRNFGEQCARLADSPSGTAAETKDNKFSKVHDFVKARVAHWREEAQKEQRPASLQEVYINQEVAYSDILGFMEELAASGPSLREKEPESMDLRGALAAAKIALHMFTNTPAEADSQRRMVFRLDPNDYLQIRQSEEAVAQALAASAPPKTEASK